MENTLNTGSPVVSVVMSAYNAESFLHEAIESVLNQTFQQFELIIINDGSTDSTLSIIKSFQDHRIKIIENDKNRGLIYSLNKGIELSKGKYIARMDADDICMPSRLENQVRMFELNQNAVIVGSNYYLLYQSKLKHIKNRNDSDYQKAVLIFTPCFCHPTVMMKNIFSQYNLSYHPNFLHAEDFKLWTDMAQYGTFLNVAKPLLKYRHHTKQVSNQYHENQLKISSDIRSAYLQKLGFKITDEQLNIINLIGDNIFIRTLESLEAIEMVLLLLHKQNNTLQVFNTTSFSNFLLKFWFDSCGNTSLGLTAYHLFFKSQIASLSHVTSRQKLILFAKCCIRRFN